MTRFFRMLARRGAIFALLGFVGLGVSSCATLSEAECASGDWRGIGFVDGSNGYDRGRLSEHAKACHPHGISPDVAAWEWGWDEGLARYCTAASGIQQGLNGAGYSGVCVGPRAELFLPAYTDALAVYEVRAQLESARARHYELTSRLEELRYEIEAERARVRDDTLTTEERHASERRVGELKSDRNYVSGDASHIESDLWRIESALREREAWLMSRYPWWNPGSGW